mmetsp:Transcript_2412/g.6970  ORF Transcript_2412/g.6970 Transcript_2412/m.6970 type:complete len:382 (+) Transcript_2412:82-1227(+)
MAANRLFGVLAAFAVVCQTDGFIKLHSKNTGTGSPPHHTKSRGNRRLAPGFSAEHGQIKANPKYERANFDPLVAAHEADADLEYLGYEQELFDEEEKEEFWGSFNISARIIEVFPMVDVNRDDMLVLEELHAWQLQNGLNASLRRSARLFNSSDIDEDGRISLHEYLSEHYHPYLLMAAPPNETASDYDDLELDIRDWHYAHEMQEKFRLADADGDAVLELAEYHEFLHPEESANAALHSHVVKREIQESDKDSDGRVSKEEFADGLWHMFYSWSEVDDEAYEWSEEKEQRRAAEKFKTIDLDGNGYIVASELLPFFYDMFPSESYYAKIQAQDVLSDADTNNDGQLSITEMLDSKSTFYSLVDDGEYYRDYIDHYYHDEF